MKKVLIIEDDKDTLAAIQYLAQDLNAEVIISSHIIPIAEVRAISPDLILLDHWIGNKLGGELCFEIKNNPNTRDVPVFIISAHHDIGEIALSSCANGFLAKPFDLDEITDTIKRFID